MTIKFETALRFTAGISMTTVFISILLSGNKELIVLLLTGIQIKVFHELRQVRLTYSSVHLQKVQEAYDWFLFTNFMSLVLISVYSKLNSTCILISFLMYTTWFILWVLTVLDVNSTKNLNQCLLHAFYIHVAILYTATQPLIINLNIANGGIFWFFFPCSLVICNDTAAYICGRLFGKRKLLNLSPNKTIEGFIGAVLITILFGYCFSGYLAQFNYMIESDQNMSLSHVYDTIRVHGVILALYASLAAPFGGYFASALKRAGKIKDFDNFIPGHGGITDRVDCQLFMAVFTFVYFNYIK